MRTLRLIYESHESLALDCERSLCKARAFVAGATGLAARERCLLEIAVANATDEGFCLDAEAVWIDAAGVGLELLGLDSAKKADLLQFVRDGSGAAKRESVACGDAERPGDPAPPPDAIPQNVHERIRSLSAREREAMARRGSLPERVALERAYAGAVWEGLLQNPQLTPPEVARIAKNGTLPRPLVGIVVSNSGWLATPEVQRALLSNPRCAGPQLERVLRAMPRGELSRLVQHCPYRAEVRTLARKLTQDR